MQLQRVGPLGAGGGAPTPTSFVSGRRYSFTSPSVYGSPNSVTQAQAQLDTLLPKQLRVVAVNAGSQMTTITFDWIGGTVPTSVLGAAAAATVLDLGASPAGAAVSNGGGAITVPASNSTSLYVALGVGAAAVAGLGWYLYQRQHTGGHGHGARETLSNPITLRMEPGYAYKRVRGEWDTVVVSENVTDRARFEGHMVIDGTRMAIFSLGRAHYAQLPQNLRRIST